MRAVARAKFVRGSARKMRQVVNLVRGRKVDEALNMLSVLPRAAATPVRKTLMSAAANALAVEGTAKLKAEDLQITTIFVDGGPIMKRIRPMGMGRAYRISKRLCHLTVVVEGEHVPEAASAHKTRKPRKAAKAAPAKPSTPQAGARKQASRTAGRAKGRSSRKAE